MPSPGPSEPPPARTLVDFTDIGLMIPRLRGGDAASVIQELTSALQQGNRVPDALPFYEAALNREFLAGTDTEAGMAFPHARLAGLSQVSFALGRSAEPLRWGPHSVNRVRLVFLMAFPATEAMQSLRVISGLARLSKQEALVARLLSAPDAARMCEVLREVSLRGSARPEVADGTSS